MSDRKPRTNVNHNYRMELQYVPDDVQPYWYVTSPDLDELMCYGTGESIEDAVQAFHESRKSAFEFYRENDIPIPEPTERQPLTASGKFVVRVPKWVHAKTVAKAKEQGVSLNSWVNAVLIANLTHQDAMASSKRRTERRSSQSQSTHNKDRIWEHGNKDSQKNSNDKNNITHIGMPDTDYAQSHYA